MDRRFPERLGSTKRIYAVRAGVLAFQFLDTFSVFDVGSHHQLIPGKGIAACDCSVRSFELALKAGVKTHFIERVSDDTILVREFKTPLGPALSRTSYGRMLPLELIWRRRFLGSLERKVRKALLSGKIDPDLIVRTGMMLNKMDRGFTTKFEDVDRDLSWVEAAQESNVLVQTLDDIWGGSLDTIIDTITFWYDRGGIKVADGKFEVALTRRGRPIVVDVFGNQEENRLLAPKSCAMKVFSFETVLDGGYLHFNKEFLREYFISIDYKDAVDAARRAGEPDPPYPDIPEEIIEEAAHRYRYVADRYTANVR